MYISFILLWPVCLHTCGDVEIKTRLKNKCGEMVRTVLTRTIPYVLALGQSVEPSIRTMYKIQALSRKYGTEFFLPRPFGAGRVVRGSTQATHRTPIASESFWSQVPRHRR